MDAQTARKCAIISAKQANPSIGALFNLIEIAIRQGELTTPFIEIAEHEWPYVQSFFTMLGYSVNIGAPKGGFVSIYLTF